MANPFIAPCTTTLTDHRQEKDLVCPYNRDHCYKMSSMQKHLINCRMGNPSGGRATCPYDESHVMPMVELEVHKAFCVSRFLAPQSKSTFEPRTESLSSIPIKTREFTPSEDWDSEECPTYDPSTRVMAGGLRVLPNMARFEKDSKPLVPISINCRLGPPVRNQKYDVGPSSSMNFQEVTPHAEPRRNRHYDPPPRFAAARSDRLYSSESSQNETSRQHQSYDSMPKSKTRQYPHFREEQAGPSRYFPHKRM